MKTWEMIKALNENPNKKFKLILCKKLNYIGSVALNYKGYLNILNKNETEILDINRMKGILIDGKWEEINRFKEVSWQEAIEAWLNGDKIYSIFNKTKRYIDENYLQSDNLWRGLSRKELKNGKWYIEN